jgi:hypothetical protein
MLRISFPVKLKHAQPVPTQVEVDASPLPWRGLTATACVAGLLSILVLQFVPDELFSSADAGFWHSLTDTKNDDQAHVMAKARSGEAAAADVLILGTSATREALWMDSKLNAQLRQNDSPNINVVNLASGAQSPIESLLITNAIQLQPGQLIVLFTSLTTLQQARPFHSIEEGGFLQSPEDLIQKYSQQEIFPSYWLKRSNRVLYQIRVMRQKLHRLLNYRLKYWIQAEAYGAPQQNYSPYLYVGQTSQSRNSWLAQIKDFETRFRKRTEINLPYVKSTLKVTLEYLTGQGCRVVIAHAPDLNDEFRKSFPNELEKFETLLRELKKSHPFEQLNLNDKIVWEARDFVDLTHVTESGRAKWSDALLTWLARQPARTNRRSN